MKFLIKGIVSFTGIISIVYILSACLDHGINGTIIASGIGLVGFFVGLLFDINISKRKV